MDIKITNIEFSFSFESKFGPLHKFRYTLDDGRIGTQNHKKPESPFKIGDAVLVEEQGEYEGMINLKLSRPDVQPFAPSNGFKSSEGGGSRNQGDIAKQWAINAAIGWVTHHSGNPQDDTLNEVSFIAQQLMKMRDEFDTYKISKLDYKDIDLPF
jgi:hypothetical protein